MRYIIFLITSLTLGYAPAIHIEMYWTVGDRHSLPFRTSEKVFCHHQNFVSAVACRDLTNFGRSGQIIRTRRQNFSQAG